MGAAAGPPPPLTAPSVIRSPIPPLASSLPSSQADRSPSFAKKNDELSPSVRLIVSSGVTAYSFKASRSRPSVSTPLPDIAPSRFEIVALRSEFRFSICSCSWRTTCTTLLSCNSVPTLKFRTEGSFWREAVVFSMITLSSAFELTLCGSDCFGHCCWSLSSCVSWPRTSTRNRTICSVAFVVVAILKSRKGSPLGSLAQLSCFVLCWCVSNEIIGSPSHWIRIEKEDRDRREKAQSHLSALGFFKNAR